VPAATLTDMFDGRCGSAREARLGWVVKEMAMPTGRSPVTRNTVRPLSPARPRSDGPTLTAKWVAPPAGTVRTAGRALTVSGGRLVECLVETEAATA
jgi:hypothetical protein